MAQVTITARSPVTRKEHRLTDARGLEWFSHYGPDGAGFGYLTFRLHRRTGRDYPDIGYGYEVRVTKGPWKTLFSGQVAKITEESGDREVLTVWVLGWVHLLGADTYNWVYCDTRLEAWASDEQPSGSFRPDLFEWKAQEGALIIQPRTNATFAAGDYTSLFYSFSFGETLRRVKADFALSIPEDWAAAGGGLRFEMIDSFGVVLWSSEANATGTIDEVVSSGPVWIELRLTMTGAGQHVRQTEDVFGALAGLKVYSVDVPMLDAAVIAQDVAAFMYRSGYGLSADTTLIQPTGLSLEPAVFIDDQTPLNVMTWCCQFGNAAGSPVAFGVAFDDTRRLFLEPYDLTSVRYVLKRNVGKLERSGDWSESAQKVYGVVSADNGGMIRSPELVASGVIQRLGGYYRREAIPLDGITSTDQLLAMLELYLSERMYPSNSGSYEVKGGVWTPEGRFVPVEEIMPGGLVQVQEWRAQEATLSQDDYRDRKTTFVLAGVRVSLDTGEAELIPRESSDTFARNMAIIQQLL